MQQRHQARPSCLSTNTCSYPTKREIADIKVRLKVFWHVRKLCRCLQKQTRLSGHQSWQKNLGPAIGQRGQPFGFLFLPLTSNSFIITRYPSERVSNTLNFEMIHSALAVLHMNWGKCPEREWCHGFGQLVTVSLWLPRLPFNPFLVQREANRIQRIVPFKISDLLAVRHYWFFSFC